MDEVKPSKRYAQLLLSHPLLHWHNMMNFIKWESLRELRMWKTNILCLINAQVQAMHPSHLSMKQIANVAFAL